ncbi:MAG TPA: GvpL/GvpF family gas vesicle protein, partial [Vicinamibacteria bacterium]|nr:GvpL/GvpF family gas vesicle protein [Vicinamibacteria bacterium]
MARPAARAGNRNGRSRPATARLAKKPAGRARAQSPEAPAEKKRPAPSPPAEVRRAATPPPATGEARSKYVYCVIESEKPQRFGPLGLGAEPSDVTTVHFRDLAAVVSDTPREVIDATRENILAHERVNEAVMRNHTVIP